LKETIQRVNDFGLFSKFQSSLLSISFRKLKQFAVSDVRAFICVAELVCLAAVVFQTLHSFHDFPKRQFAAPKEKQEEKRRKMKEESSKQL
jgi:hypothetical protein